MLTQYKLETTVDESTKIFKVVLKFDKKKKKTIAFKNE